MEDAALVFQKGSTGQGPQEGLLGIICLCKTSLSAQFRITIIKIGN